MSFASYLGNHLLDWSQVDTFYFSIKLADVPSIRTIVGILDKNIIVGIHKYSTVFFSTKYSYVSSLIIIFSEDY